MRVRSYPLGKLSDGGYVYIFPGLDKALLPISSLLEANVTLKLEVVLWSQSQLVSRVKKRIALLLKRMQNGNAIC